MSEIVISALRLLEKEARRLRGELKNGKTLTWKDVKILLKALGALAEDKQILDEAASKSFVYVIGLNSFATFVRKL